MIGEKKLMGVGEEPKRKSIWQKFLIIEGSKGPREVDMTPYNMVYGQRLSIFFAMILLLFVLLSV